MDLTGNINNFIDVLGDGIDYTRTIIYWKDGKLQYVSSMAIQENALLLPLNCPVIDTRFPVGLEDRYGSWIGKNVSGCSWKTADKSTYPKEFLTQLLLLGIP